MPFVTSYLATAAVFLVIDALWLGIVARTFYARQLGELMRPDPNFVVAGLFYLVYVVGIVYLAVRPGWQANSLGVAAVHGIVLGLVAYGTYDLTNLATIRNWPLPVAVVDVIWGTALTAVSATAGLAITRWLS